MNAVAILGKDIHNEQLTLLMNAGAHKLILALDNDKAGALGTSKALRTASSLFTLSTAKIPEHRKDVGEMTKEEIIKVFKKCKSSNVTV
jgi:DNA primase